MALPVDEKTIHGMAAAAAKERHEALRVEYGTLVKWGGMSPTYRERRTADARRYVVSALRYLERS